MSDPTALNSAVDVADANGSAVASTDTDSETSSSEHKSVRPKLPKKFWVGLTIVGLYALIAIFAPWIAPHDPNAQDVVNRLADPSSEHLVGTDEVGRDVFSRLIHAARIDLTVGILGALFPLIVGTILGAIAGYAGRWVDVVIMRVADVVQAFPAYILIIALVFALGQGASTILLAFTLTVWVIYARLIRDEILRVRNIDYVHAARAADLPHWRIVGRHILPNTISQTVVYFTTDILYAILALAAFSFIGLGIHLQMRSGDQ